MIVRHRLGDATIPFKIDIGWDFLALVLAVHLVPAAVVGYAFRKSGPLVAGAAAAGTAAIVWGIGQAKVNS